MTKSTRVSYWAMLGILLVVGFLHMGESGKLTSSVPLWATKRFVDSQD